VQINGTSITQDGVANIPLASGDTTGVVKFGSINQSGLSLYNGNAVINSAANAQIDARNTGVRPIVPTNINYAVKAALTDAKRIGHNGDAELTSAEMDNACAVLGAERKKGEWVLKGTIVDGNGVTVDLTSCTELMCIGTTVGTSAAHTTINGISISLVNDTVRNGVRAFMFKAITENENIVVDYAKYANSATIENTALFNQPNTYFRTNMTIEGITSINLNYSPCILQRRRSTKATAMNGANRSKAAALLLCTCDPMKKERTNPLAQKTVSNRLSRCSGFIFARPVCLEAFVEIPAGMDNCC